MQHSGQARADVFPHMQGRAIVGGAQQHSTQVQTCELTTSHSLQRQGSQLRREESADLKANGAALDSVPGTFTVALESKAGELSLKPLSLIAVILWDWCSIFMIRLNAFMVSTSRISADGPCMLFVPLTSHTMRTKGD